MSNWAAGHAYYTPGALSPQGESAALRPEMSSSVAAHLTALQWARSTLAALGHGMVQSTSRR